MKKLLLSALAVCAFTFSNAQETETETFGFAHGDIFVEGNVMFNSSNDKNTEIKTNGVNFMPTAGYFINDDLAVGVNLNIGSNKSEQAGTDTSDWSNFGAGVFARYYFLDLGKRFKTYGQFGVGFDSSKDGMADVKYTDINVGAGLGLNYFVKNNIAISVGLTDLIGFNSSKSDIDGDKGTTSFGMNLNEHNNFFSNATFGLLFKF